MKLATSKNQLSSVGSSDKGFRQTKKASSSPSSSANASSLPVVTPPRRGLVNKARFFGFGECELKLFAQLF